MDAIALSAEGISDANELRSISRVTRSARSKQLNLQADQSSFGRSQRIDENAVGCSVQNVTERSVAVQRDALRNRHRAEPTR
jgi:hypothetical protein